jgi:2-amino-4-hydroxy-6-hydroxymethyldihydropteridine diphosphokinase
MPPETVFVALGSNLDQPLDKVVSGMAAIATLADTQLLASSSLYQSAAIGPSAQDDYINAVAKIVTALKPLQLLDALQTIEVAHGRKRGIRWAARSLDLDLLLYGEQQLKHSRLTVPHPEMTQRNFVLLPLQEIAPDLILPSGQTLTTVLSHCPPNGITKLPNRGAR